MRIHSAAAVLALFLPACQSDEARKAPAAGAPLELVEANALASWDGDPRFWSVANGCIVGRSSPEVPCNDTTYLVWRGGEVADFELECEYRITGGNSGIQFRSRDAGRWKVAGFQADIEDGPDWSGCLYEQDGRGVVARRGERVQLEPNSARKTSFGERAQLDAAAKSGDWNQYRIRAIGPHVELTLNGVRTVEVLDLDAQRFQPRGKLALQLHAGGPMTIEVRSIRLTHLKPDSRDVVRFFGETAADGDEVSGPRVATPPPQWLWSGPQPREGESVAFQRRFDAPRSATKALLRATADNRLRVFVNGELALTVDEWFRPREADVSKLLRAGDNVITALAWNESSLAGMWVELLLESEGKRVLRLVTDGSWSAHVVASGEFESWSASHFDAARAGAPHVLGAVGMEPWHSMGPAMRGGAAPTEATDESALAASELELPEGFRAELLHSVPKGEQGSWVTLCEDPQGRFYVSDQYGPLYRVTPPALGASGATRVERVELPLGSAHGLCWAFDSLYAVVAESGTHKPGLYRCRDTNNDDVLDTAELLREFEGGGEHGPHAVVLGPDQKLWIVGGNHTKLPEPLDATWMARAWAEDLLLPRIDDPNGHAVGILAPGGWIVRTDENAQRWELWATGFRNAYDIAFDERGELFTFDSDMEWDVGLPWYRPARVCQVPPGAEFGWRHGSGKWPSYYVDSMPATCDIGLASPTGVTFATNSGFPDTYKRAFFAADWAYGKIYAVRGDKFEPFLAGKPFPVTDLVVAKDGAMYVTTGGRRTQSGLYRVSWTKPIEESTATAIGRSRASSSGEGLRARLDPSAPAPTAKELESYANMLGGVSVSARAARAVIERATPEQLVELLTVQSDPRRIAPLAAAAIRVAPVETAQLVLRRLSAQPLVNVGEGYRLDTLRAMGLALLRAEVDHATRVSWADKLAALFPYGMERTDREVAQLLAHLGDARVIEPALELIASSRTQEEKLWYAYCLRVVKQGWSLAQRRALLAFLDGEARTFAGGHSLLKYVERIRAEFEAGMSDEERAALAADLARPASTTTVASTTVASFVRAWTRADLAPLVREPLHGRDFDRGRAAYAKSRCTECHRLGGEGGSTGPDLTGAGSRFSRLDFLDALLTPSAVISDQYQDTEFLTHEGDLFVGRIEGELNGLVKLRRLPPQDDVLEFEASEIASRRPHPLSRMPSGLIDVLDEGEVLDLLAYVLSGGVRGN